MIMVVHRTIPMLIVMIRPYRKDQAGVLPSLVDHRLILLPTINDHHRDYHASHVVAHPTLVTLEEEEE